jgi:hypothetical protein
MKIKIPAVEKEVCDICGRDGILETCVVCGNRYCLICHCYLPGCMVRPDVCKKCDSRADVNQISKRFGLLIHDLCKQREAELKQLAPNNVIRPNPESDH